MRFNKITQTSSPGQKENHEQFNSPPNHREESWIKPSSRVHEELRVRGYPLEAVPAARSGRFFGLPSDLTVLNYVGDAVYFEVFLHEGERPAARSAAHVWLEVENLEGFLERCRAMDVPVTRAPRGDRWITIIQDYDDNLFEIKAVAA